MFSCRICGLNEFYFSSFALTSSEFFFRLSVTSTRSIRSSNVSWAVLRSAHMRCMVDGVFVWRCLSHRDINTVIHVACYYKVTPSWYNFHARETSRGSSWPDRVNKMKRSWMLMGLKAVLNERKATICAFAPRNNINDHRAYKFTLRLTSNARGIQGDPK